VKRVPSGVWKKKKEAKGLRKNKGEEVTEENRSLRFRERNPSAFSRCAGSKRIEGLNPGKGSVQHGRKKN